MFELSIAFKYLLPRWRHLSQCIISLLSTCVIALVIWLVVVFFSVTHGLEHSWIQRLIALTSPIRVTPTDAYYRSYYYQIDGAAAASGYQLKTIREKLNGPGRDPYQLLIDGDLPGEWPTPDLEADGSLKDLVKKAHHAASTLPAVSGLAVRDFEITAASLRLNLLRSSENRQIAHSSLTQTAYLASIDPENKNLRYAQTAVTIDDLNNVLHKLRNSPGEEILTDRFCAACRIQEVATPSFGWELPRHLLPPAGTVRGFGKRAFGRWHSVLISDQLQGQGEGQGHGDDASGWTPVTVQWAGVLTVHPEGGESSSLPSYVPLLLPGGIPMHTEVSTIAHSQTSGVPLKVHFSIQGISFDGIVPLLHSSGDLVLTKAEALSDLAENATTAPLWVHTTGNKAYMHIPAIPQWGDGILLPKSYRDAGVRLGDQGHLSYMAPTITAVHEQQLPVYVAGFYDPGIISVGGKLILAPEELVAIIHTAQANQDALKSNGFNVRFDRLEDVDLVKKALQNAFDKAGISPYWHIETYREFDFTKDLIQQLRSERNLWTLLATVIILVACSNIFSMLTILVNDKRKEIGILRSMGASGASIAAVFGICGMTIGMAGSIVGMFFAWITLENLQHLLDWIGSLQGHEMFNPLFYGNSLPSEISGQAIAFVLITTGIISLISGMIPAVKACMLHPAAILRGE